MFQTTINLKGKDRVLQFSTWVNGEIEKVVKEGAGSIQLLANLIFFGIIQGEKLRSKYFANEDIGFDVFDCFDWIDEQEGGLKSKIVEDIQELYVKHNNINVPKDEPEKNLKATTPKKQIKK
jgi:hypothetical protein